MKFHTLLVALAGCFIAKSQDTGGYQEIEYDPNNQQLVDTMNFGLQAAISQQYAHGILDTLNWDFGVVNSVQSQVVNGINYDFNVDISDAEEDIAVLDFVVNVAPDNKTKTLVSSSVVNFIDGEQD